MAEHIYHFKHGWIPLDHVAVTSHSKTAKSAIRAAHTDARDRGTPRANANERTRAMKHLNSAEEARAAGKMGTMAEHLDQAARHLDRGGSTHGDKMTHLARQTRQQFPAVSESPNGDPVNSPDPTPPAPDPNLRPIGPGDTSDALDRAAEQRGTAGGFVPPRTDGLGNRFGATKPQHNTMQAARNGDIAKLQKAGVDIQPGDQIHLHNDNEINSGSPPAITVERPGSDRVARYSINGQGKAQNAGGGTTSDFHRTYKSQPVAVAGEGPVSPTAVPYDTPSRQVVPSSSVGEPGKAVGEPDPSTLTDEGLQRLMDNANHQARQAKTGSKGEKAAADRYNTLKAEQDRRAASSSDAVPADQLGDVADEHSEVARNLSAKADQEGLTQYHSEAADAHRTAADAQAAAGQPEAAAEHHAEAQRHVGEALGGLMDTINQDAIDGRGDPETEDYNSARQDAVSSVIDQFKQNPNIDLGAYVQSQLDDLNYGQDLGEDPNYDEGMRDGYQSALELIKGGEYQSVQAAAGIQPDGAYLATMAMSINELATLDGIDEALFSATAAERRKAAKDGRAMSDGSYPIRNRSELQSAIRVFPRGEGNDKTKDGIKRHIIKQARKLRAIKALPETWGVTAAGGTIVNADDPDTPLTDDEIFALIASALTEVPPAEVPDDLGGGVKFRIPLLIPTDLETGDRREFKSGGLTSRDFPLPLYYQTLTDDGHKNSAIVARIDHAEKVKNGIGNAVGEFDTGEHAEEALRLIRNLHLRGVSADVDKTDAEATMSEQDGKPKVVFDKGRLTAGTLVGKPAFAECQIELPGDEEWERNMARFKEEYGDKDVKPLVAAGGPIAPPRAWFDNPNLTEPTHLTVEDDGRVFGHIAAWGIDHIGMPFQQAPRSKSGYRYFATGQVKTAEGELINVGQLTLAGGHADTSLTADLAVKHYDDTNSAVADVAIGEDEFGIWVAGAQRPDLSEAQVRQFRASDSSGDWRPIQGNLELVACCQVNCAGFPIPRARVASGHVLALTAAGAPAISRKAQHAASELAGHAAVETRLERLERIDADRRAAVAAELRATVAAGRQRLIETTREGLVAAASTLSELRRPRAGESDPKAPSGRVAASGSTGQGEGGATPGAGRLTPSQGVVFDGAMTAASGLPHVYHFKHGWIPLDHVSVTPVADGVENVDIHGQTVGRVGVEHSGGHTKYRASSRAAIPLGTHDSKDDAIADVVASHRVAEGLPGGSKDKSITNADLSPAAGPSAPVADTPSGIHIEHTGDGTLVHGTSKGDGTAPILKQHGFRWSSNLGAWYLPRGQHETTRRMKADAVHRDLGAAGHDAAITKDAGSTTTAAEREAARREQAAGRADRMDQRAQRQATEADVQEGRARQIGDMIPMGQPILVGHHSEGRHRNDLKRMDTAMRKSFEADQASKDAAAAAERARQTAAGESPLHRIRRAERNEAEIRKIDRTLEQHDVAVRKPDAAARFGIRPLSDTHLESLRAERARLADQVQHDRAQVEQSGHTQIRAEDISPGDTIHYRGRTHTVSKVNKTTVSVPTGYSWDDKVPISQITKHEKATPTEPDSTPNAPNAATSTPELQKTPSTHARQTVELKAALKDAGITARTIRSDSAAPDDQSSGQPVPTSDVFLHPGTDAEAAAEALRRVPWVEDAEAQDHNWVSVRGRTRASQSNDTPSAPAAPAASNVPSAISPGATSPSMSAKKRRAFQAASEGDHAWLAEHGFDAQPGDTIHANHTRGVLAIDRPGETHHLVQPVNGNGRSSGKPIRIDKSLGNTEGGLSDLYQKVHEPNTGPTPMPQPGSNEAAESLKNRVLARRASDSETLDAARGKYTVKQVNDIVTGKDDHGATVREQALLRGRPPRDESAGSGLPSPISPGATSPGMSAKMRRAFQAASEGDHAWLRGHGFDAPDGSTIRANTREKSLHFTTPEGHSRVHRVTGNGQARDSFDRPSNADSPDWQTVHQPIGSGAATGDHGETTGGIAPDDRPSALGVVYSARAGLSAVKGYHHGSHASSTRSKRDTASEALDEAEQHIEAGEPRKAATRLRYAASQFPSSSPHRDMLTQASNRLIDQDRTSRGLNPMHQPVSGEETAPSMLTPGSKVIDSNARERTVGRVEGDTVHFDDNKSPSSTDIGNVTPGTPAARSAPLKSGDRVKNEYGTGTISDSTDRSVTISLDSGEKINVQRGTPGFDRIQRDDSPAPAAVADNAIPATTSDQVYPSSQSDALDAAKTDKELMDALTTIRGTQDSKGGAGVGPLVRADNALRYGDELKQQDTSRAAIAGHLREAASQMHGKAATMSNPQEAGQMRRRAGAVDNAAHRLMYGKDVAGSDAPIHSTARQAPGQPDRTGAQIEGGVYTTGKSQRIGSVGVRQVYKGRDLEIKKGKEWGTLQTFVNGHPIGTPYGRTAADADRELNSLRNTIDFADENPEPGRWGDYMAPKDKYRSGGAAPKA